MNGLELLEWLKDIPETELAKTNVILESGNFFDHLVTAKYYKGIGVFLINK